jgi:hypothetical protein
VICVETLLMQLVPDLAIIVGLDKAPTSVSQPKRDLAATISCGDSVKTHSPDCESRFHILPQE